MTPETSQTERNVRDELLHVAVDILNQDGPDGLQTRKIASAAGTSTMAVYTYFGGMPGLIAAVAEEGLRQFDAAMTMPSTSDPVADLMATGIAYRRYAIERPHMYRSMLAGRIAAGSPADDATVVAIAAQFWASIHGFVMLELAGSYGAEGSAVGPVLAALTTNLLVALGDTPERVRKSQQASVQQR